MNASRIVPRTRGTHIVREIGAASQIAKHGGHWLKLGR